MADRQTTRAPRPRRSLGGVLVIAAAALALTLEPAAASAAPPNDDFANATAVGSFPYTDTVDNASATMQADEPQWCVFAPRTVWYAITPPSNGVIRADVAGTAFFDTVLRVFRDTGSGIAGLNFVDCTINGGSLAFAVAAGRTYYIQASDWHSGGGALRLNVSFTAPPAHDDFASAKEIASLPFADSVEVALASTEPGERTPSCGFGTPTATLWYAYTPQTGGSVSATVGGSLPAVAAYTGSSLAGLTEIGCRTFGGALTFHVDPDTTYYFQTSTFSGVGGSLQLNVRVAPDPLPNFFHNPFDPSAYDVVQFVDTSFDPAQVGIQTRTWDFGDGATATGCCTSHKYARDGDYVTTLTVTTADGRTASLERPIHVQTHDVAITKLAVPQSASAGQTRQISVGLASNRAPEVVEVQLLKALPGGGYATVGTSTQSVPVRSASRTTAFDFNYTFTAGDASIGKVTFKAVARIVGARDALPGDNEIVGTPTKISR